MLPSSKVAWWRQCFGPRPCHGQPRVQRHGPGLLRLPQAQERSVHVLQDQEPQEEGLAGKITSSARECFDKIRRRQGSTRQSRSSTIPFPNVLKYLTLYTIFLSQIILSWYSVTIGSKDFGKIIVSFIFSSIIKINIPPCANERMWLFVSVRLSTSYQWA